MSLITRSDLQNQFVNIKKSLNKGVKEKKTLYDQIFKQSKVKNYNIFLSHSYWDANEILGLKQLLNDFGYSVFVDWENEDFKDRNSVTPVTASKLKGIMDNCDCLLFAFTVNSKFSKWMPWELGYFDGKKGRVAIVPILDSKQEKFKGSEYLSIYPYLSLDPITLDWFGTARKIENKIMINYADKIININKWFNNDTGYTLLPLKIP